MNRGVSEFQSNQSQDYSFFGMMDIDAYRVGLSYCRSMECRISGEPGQDYDAYRVGRGSLQFCVCDGVGQSYFGDAAARFIGDLLITWLGDKTFYPDIGCKDSLAEQLAERYGLEPADVTPRPGEAAWGLYRRRAGQ